MSLVEFRSAVDSMKSSQLKAAWRKVLDYIRGGASNEERISKIFDRLGAPLGASLGLSVVPTAGVSILELAKGMLALGVSLTEDELAAWFEGCDAMAQQHASVVALLEAATLGAFVVAMACTRIDANFPVPWSFLSICAAVLFIGLGCLPPKQRWGSAGDAAESDAAGSAGSAAGLGIPVPLRSACVGCERVCHLS